MPATTNLSGSIGVNVQLTQVGAVDFANVQAAINQAYSTAFTFGPGANQADLVFFDQRTLAASATEDLDLAGVLVDALGVSLTFARIKAIVVKAAAGNTNSVQVTRPVNGVPLFMASADGISLAPGELFVWASPSAAGKVVTASTGDLITVTNSAGSTGVTYDVIIVGAAT